MKTPRVEIERFIPTLRQFARALVDNHRADQADDLVHEALEEVVRGERPLTITEAETRLYARLVGAYRMRARAQAEDRRTAPGGSGHGDGSPMRQGAGGPLAPASSMLSGGLDRLPLNEREALLLVVIGRFDYARVADILGVPVSTVITRLVQARETLGAGLWSPAVRARPTGAHLRLVKS